MADTIPAVETANQPVVKNDVKPVVAPPAVNNDVSSEAEKLKKELEQTQMRANQLQNQLDAKAKAEEEAKAKQLEEQNEFKSLYEQEKAKREASEQERQAAEQKETLRLSQETIFAEFSEEAIEVAKEAGLTLKDDSDEAKVDFKSRLDKISQKVASKPVGANNGRPTEKNVDKAAQIQAMRAGNKEAKEELIGGLPVLDQMRQQAGYTNK